MKARFLFWSGVAPHDIPVRDLISFNEHAEEMIEEVAEMLKDAVAGGVGEAIDNIDFK